MSTRRAARTLDERVASIEEFVRRLQGDTAVTPTDTRFLYTARGEILVASATNDPAPLPAGDPDDVLSMGAGSMPEWRDPDRVKLSDIGDIGFIFVGTEPGDGTWFAPGPDGTVLTADSTTPTGLRWV